MLKGYTNRIAVENYLMTTIDASYWSQLNEFIEQVEAYIERISGRVFIADSVASEKLYDGDGENNLEIDDCVAVTKIEVDDEEILAADYYLYPANILPKNMIQLDCDIFTEEYQNVTVTAKWGYSVAVPTDIAWVAMVLVAGIIQNTDELGDGIQSYTTGNFTVSYKNDGQIDDYEKAEKIIKSYRKFNF